MYVAIKVLGHDGTNTVVLGLYTILPLPILYGVSHTQGESVGVFNCPITVQ